jgi:hypothetical protein
LKAGIKLFNVFLMIVHLCSVYVSAGVRRTSKLEISSRRPTSFVPRVQPQNRDLLLLAARSVPQMNETSRGT